MQPCRDHGWCPVGRATLELTMNGERVHLHKLRWLRVESRKLPSCKQRAVDRNIAANWRSHKQFHQLRSLRLLICTPHAKRSNGKSTCGRRAYLRSLVCSPFWNDHCDLPGDNQAWLPNYLESKKIIREIHLFIPNFSSLPAEKSKFRGASFGSTISGTPY